VYVVPEFRRQGVFRRLYDFLRESAESDPGVVGLRLYIEDGNERALQTYLRSGMKQAGYFVMERLFIDVSNVPD
ncbi:MAG: GNAT family N-acetyltransferase, partial [Planctomycetes bacterium]|nr:GNAT family N-acetyltransferase [Planctomycetota bacterium]